MGLLPFLKLAIPAASLEQCRDAPVGCNVLFPCQDLCKLDGPDLEQHASVLKAVLVYYAGGAPSLVELGESITQMDVECQWRLSRRRSVAERRTWALGQAGVIMALLSYLRRLWRKHPTRSESAIIQATPRTLPCTN